MNQLVYPEDGGAQTAKALADAIRSQVVELQEVTKQATIQTEKLKPSWATVLMILPNWSACLTIIPQKPLPN